MGTGDTYETLRDERRNRILALINWNLAPKAGDYVEIMAADERYFEGMRGWLRRIDRSSLTPFGVDLSDRGNHFDPRSLNWVIDAYKTRYRGDDPICGGPIESVRVDPEDEAKNQQRFEASRSRWPGPTATRQRTDGEIFRWSLTGRWS